MAVIGAGALGGVLARRLVQRGYGVGAVFSRTEAAAQRLAEAVGATTASAALEALPSDVDTVFCCVPDAAVERVAERLYLLPRDWSATLVAHTSGALTADALAPVRVRGAAALSFHPMQTFTTATAPEAFDGIAIGLEGDERAVRRGQRLARDLGGRPVVLSADDKVRYHLAASMASNFFVTLMALAREVMETTQLEAGAAEALLQPLVERTWRNLGEQDPEEALSGPIARGDVATVRRHLDALRQRLPHLTPAYVAMAMETVRLAVRSGRLAEPDARRLLDVLHASVL